MGETKKYNIQNPELERFLLERKIYGEILNEKPLEDLISEEELKKICGYLENPTSSGIWFLDGIWLENEGITEKILHEVKAIEEQKIKSKRKKPQEIERKISEVEKSVLKTAKKMTFALGLFGYLSSSGDSDKQKYDRDLERDDILLIEAVKEKFEREYSKEIDYFKSNIVCPSFKPSVRSRGFIHLKDGLINDWDSEMTEQTTRPFTFISLEHEPLEKMAAFFKSIGKISEYDIYPIYSPEEEVFEPYSTYLKFGIKRIFDKGKMRDLILQSISTFESGNDAYSISTVGLVLEEQLTQIYETLFRVKCPQGLTLGQLLDRINSEVEERDSKKEKTLAQSFDFNDIYKRINAAIEVDTLANKDLLIILRDMLTLTKEKNAGILAQLNASDNVNESYSVFPTQVRDRMDELLKFRNAISHRSRTPVGSFEATKSLFDLVSLSMWWREEKKLVNWTDNPDDIIRQMVKRNNPNNESFMDRAKKD